jgi:hypothetical protein
MTCLYCDNTGKYVLPYKGDIGEPCTRCPAGDLAKIREAWEKYLQCAGPYGAMRAERFKATHFIELSNFVDVCGDLFGWDHQRSQEFLQGEKTEQEHGG